MKSDPTTADTRGDAALAGAGTAHGATTPGAATHEGDTRTAVVDMLLQQGPVTASEVGRALGLSAAGVRRHLDALIEAGEAREVSHRHRASRGRGRPAKRFQITAQGRRRLGHAYDDLAGAALRQLREVGGDAAITEFARRRVDTIVDRVAPADGPRDIARAADEVADAFNDAGFAASTRPVGHGVQICQHHCPVSHVAEEFPELCDAEREALTEILGTHVQQLATIANGDVACTTHVPLVSPPDPAEPEPTARDR
ncbi:helix-turn-helix transcriptional regulator [Rhodococcus rhodnii]|uniref:Transcriptional regulator n=1 Tax=Rhodococcus rhodnii LMG 5362 TaxID=1273125 RepID=R7WII6_9NOCA|nr:transcriptional regulator [Rhodococcus rhodnii LMG 5362]